MEYDFHRDKLDDLRYTPKNLTNAPAARAHQADKDARRLIRDIRQLDPEQIWGRINRWAHANPQRVLAVIVSLAAMADLEQADTDEPPSWTAAFGGTAGLHPDYGKRPQPRPVDKDALRAERDRIIVRLLKTDLTFAAIAERVGVGMNTVQRAAAKHGLSRTHAETAERDAEIMHMLGQGIHRDDVAKAAGCTTRTVDRVAQRARENRGAAA